jgi:hypothetical protein
LGGLNSINSGISEKRNWWERTCNTAQKGGEDSAFGSNDCRVLPRPYWVIKGMRGKGYVSLNRLGNIIITK